MKKLIFVLFVCLTVFTACKKSKQEISDPVESQISEYDYDLVLDKTIIWNDLLTQEVPRYDAYVYSPGCGHCNEIKQQVIEQSLVRNDFFFISYNKSIPVGDDASLTIGATDIENVFILGTPSLLTVENGVLIGNIAGKKAILEAL